MSHLLKPLLIPVHHLVSVFNLPLLVANPFSTRRLPLHARDFPLVLLYTARAGSSALIKWFLFQTGHLDAAADVGRGVHRLARSLQQQQQRAYGWEALRLVMSHEKPILKLVRNPYDRAVSSFLSVVLHSRQGLPNPWGRELVIAARRHAGRAETSEPTLSFRDFLRFLAKNGTRSGEVNGHVACQHVAGEDGRIDRLIRLERFGEEITEIERQYGLKPSPLEWIGRLRNEEGWREEPHGSNCAADVEFTPELVRQQRFPAYAAFYDGEARGLVQHCFAADFKAYGYEAS